MNLEKQVCSLELAKKLKELRVKQESLFNWMHKWEGSSDENAGEDYVCFSPDKSGYNSRWICSAFTVAELGEIMKGKGMGISAWSEITLDGGWWMRGGEWIAETRSYKYLVTDEKEADARAKMLIYLIEQKLITV